MRLLLAAALAAAAGLLTPMIACGGDSVTDKIRARCAKEVSASDAQDQAACVDRQVAAAKRVQSLTMTLASNSPAFKILIDCMEKWTEFGNVDWYKGLACYLGTAR